MTKKYEIIKEDLINKISNGLYVPNKMLPSERELTDYYNVSRMTIRRALDELIQDGLLIRKSGSGVFISEEKKTRSFDKISFQHDSHLHQIYGDIKIKLLEFKEVTNHPIAIKLLRIQKDDVVYQLKRIQYSKDQIIVYENIFLPKKYFGNLTKEQCNQSMEDIVSKYCKIECNNNDVEVEVLKASKKISTYLQVPFDSAILRLNIIQKKDDQPIYCGVDMLDGNEYKYVQSSRYKI
ncbi:MAG: GntR family transcriptional regulator [Thomasclavelia sp.]|nr:GntR family transcriptional regulator [Thomasclavelia sp.]